MTQYYMSVYWQITDWIVLVSRYAQWAKSFHTEVKLASPPFWGSTLFVSIPFGITNANVKKKYVKVCTEKIYTHIFCPSLDPNPRTSKMINFCILVPKLTQPRSSVANCAIIVGVIQNNFLCQISNLWLKLAH